MPIDERFRTSALEKLRKVEEFIKQKEAELLEDTDQEDLEYGINMELSLKGLGELWEEAIEKNHYMEVVFTEVMEHHDGAYLKVSFRNSLGDTYAERYVSIWSSGKVDISHTFFMKLGDIRLRVERVKEDTFRLFMKK
ncbi:hypothetical protein [Hydrogenobacter hydrogenophilus]|uniref:Uncharacterized protein n=1 Tax=Hydrogenobacter hydrogenophilus TaxID=35835 RepID=A0A285P5L9_9AQUI|nr:hypothetical protein [Hydrogenobacter hydrogenophilus]SNZ17015.1 hypothetical protein SAMN06265353_1761 [Hydrogenobacter hydrogenophilus]